MVVYWVDFEDFLDGFGGGNSGNEIFVWRYSVEVLGFVTEIVNVVSI